MDGSNGKARLREAIAARDAAAGRSIGQEAWRHGRIGHARERDANAAMDAAA